MICYNHNSHKRILTGFVLLAKTLFQWLGSNLSAHPVYAAVVETSGALRSASHWDVSVLAFPAQR